MLGQGLVKELGLGASLRELIGVADVMSLRLGLSGALDPRPALPDSLE